MGGRERGTQRGAHRERGIERKTVCERVHEKEERGRNGCMHDGCRLSETFILKQQASKRCVVTQ